MATLSKITLVSRFLTVLAVAPLAVSVVFACKRTTPVEPPFEETSSSTTETHAAHIEDSSDRSGADFFDAGIDAEALGKRARSRTPR